MHLAKHPCLHVVEEVTVERPAPGRIRGYEITESLSRFDIDRVLVGSKLTMLVLKFAPEAVQVDRVFHHRVIDQHEAHPIAALYLDWPGLGEFLAVEAPDEALHIAGQMQRDLVRRRTRIAAGLCRSQIGVGEHSAPRRKSLTGAL